LLEHIIAGEFDEELEFEEELELEEDEFGSVRRITRFRNLAKQTWLCHIK
jgi:hypothetical protein